MEKETTRQNSPWSILIEEIKSVRVEQSEKPQHQDQSKRVLWQNSNNWTTVFSSSSKARRFRSDQIVHIKQPRPNPIYQNYASQANETNRIISPQMNLVWPNRSQTTGAYTSTKNELSDKKVTSDPQILHFNSTNNIDSPMGDHEA